MKFSIKKMKFSIYEIFKNSSFVLFVTEFSYHMYRKNAVLNGKQKQMKPLQVALQGQLEPSKLSQAHKPKIQI